MWAARWLGIMSLLTISLSAPGSNVAWSQGMTPDQTILQYQRMLQRNPGDARTYYRLGDAYVQKARESGDVTYFNLAEQALRKARQIDPEYSDALRHLAFVLYSRHDFEGAATEAKRAIDLNPADPHAYGILGDAWLEIGKYGQAADAYRTMIRLGEDLYSYSRLAGLKSIQGDTGGAIEDLKRAIKAGQASVRPGESVAWAQWQLGSDYFATGNLRAAEEQYLEALKSSPNYYRALAGLGQVRTAQERYGEAIDLYQKAIAIIPLPDYAAALGDVHAKLGLPQDARKQYDLVEYIGYLNSVNKILYNRELAYFYADHGLKLNEALELAKKELEVRQDIYAYDLLAWVLYKNGKPREALPLMEAAMRLGTKDAKLYFHAGMIYHALGRTELAREHLRQALDLNPHFHILQASVAKQTLKSIDEIRP